MIAAFRFFAVGALGGEGEIAIGRARHMASKRTRDAPLPLEAEEITVLHLDDEDGSDANAPPLTVSMDNHGRVAGVGSLVIHKSLDVHTKVARNALSPGLARDLRHDCHAAFNAGSSFWLGVTDEPRCALEHMAKAVFDAHCDPEKVANKLDDTKTGAEWWVQMRCDDRDATEANAYNPLPTRDKNNPAGVSFHWDKDENLVDQFGVCVCPAVSTVTYVTDQGELPDLRTFNPRSTLSINLETNIQSTND